MYNLNQPPAGPQGEQPPAPPKWISLIWLLLIVLIGIWLVPALLNAGGSQANEAISYYFRCAGECQ